MKRLLSALLAIIIIFSISSTSFAVSYIITGDYVNLRSTPQIKQDNIIERLHYGDIVEVYTVNQNWFFVGVNHKIGYVSADYIGIQSSGIAGIITSNVNFRRGPSKKHNSYGIILKGTIVKVLDNSNKWFQIEYNDNIAYVLSDYIELKQINNEELLGIYTTSFSTTSEQKGRSKNIKKSADMINEIKIEPHSSFSLLESIGPITRDAGYFSAPEYIQNNGKTQTIIGYGGGVCQLATTLYQSVLNAFDSGCNIEILERHVHSKSVSYVEKGEDATISWSSKKDFSFENQNDYSIKIRTFVQDGAITCMIYKCN